jgi:uncharacterized protein (PEP-CTERM system associated)
MTKWALLRTTFGVAVKRCRYPLKQQATVNVARRWRLTSMFCTLNIAIRRKLVGDLLIANRSLSMRCFMDWITHQATILSIKSIFLMAVLFIPSVSAMHWSFAPSAVVESVFTDNVLLETDNPQFDLLMRLAPNFVLNANSGRSQLDVAYSLEYLDHLATDIETELNHRLQLNAHNTLYRDQLFLDTTTSIDQVLIDSFGPSSGDTITAPENLQTVYTYTISPSYKTQLGQYATLKLLLTHNAVFYSDEGEDSFEYGGQFDLTGGSFFNALSWSVNAAYQQINYTSSENETSVSNTISVGLQYQFYDELAFAINTGYEQQQLSTTATENGLTWESSLNWHPSTRTQLRLGVTQHYFGWSPVLEWHYQRRRSTWTANYRRELSSSRNEALRATTFDFEDSFGEPQTPTTDQPGQVLTGEAAPNTSEFVINQFQTTYALNTRRGVFNADFNYTVRESTSQGDETSVHSQIGWQHHLNAMTTATVSAGWNYRQAAVTQAVAETEEINDYQFDFGLKHNASRFVSTYFNYRAFLNEDYTENRVTVGLQLNWGRH